MSIFAEYHPSGPRGSLPDDLAVRPASVDDIAPLAALRVERGDAGPEEAAAAFTALLGRGGFVLAAERDGTVVAYGAAEHLDLPGIPAGWYLGGLIVTPSLRRCGIGALLTERRLAWIRERSAEAYYFANETNRVSIDLHARFGFVEVARDIRVPRVTFRGGVGLLFRAPLRSE